MKPLLIPLTRTGSLPAVSPEALSQYLPWAHITLYLTWIKILGIHRAFSFPVVVFVLFCLPWLKRLGHCYCSVRAILLSLVSTEPLFYWLTFSFIPIPYSHSPLATGHCFTVVMGIFIWMYSCKMFIVDLYAYTLKVYVKDIMHDILFCVLISVLLTWCYVTSNSSCLTCAKCPIVCTRPTLPAWTLRLPSIPGHYRHMMNIFRSDPLWVCIRISRGYIARNRIARS